MTRNELFQKLTETLDGEGLAFQSIEEDGEVMLKVPGEDADIECRVFFTDEPLMIHAVAGICVRAPKQRLNTVSLELHEMTAHTALGAFSLSKKERTVVFRVGLPFRGVVDHSAVIKLALWTALRTMDISVPKLMSLFYDSTMSDEVEDRVLPPRGTSPPQAPDGQRPEAN